MNSDVTILYSVIAIVRLAGQAVAFGGRRLLTGLIRPMTLPSYRCFALRAIHRMIASADEQTCAALSDSVSVASELNPAIVTLCGIDPLARMRTMMRNRYGAISTM